jgi:hypothetical protein
MSHWKMTLCVTMSATIGIWAGSAWGMPTLGVNLLQAPGFEVAEGAPDATAGDVSTTGNPWSGWNPWVPPYTAWYTSRQARSGNQSGFTFGDPGGIYQYVDVSGAAGLPFESSAWFLNLEGDALVPGKSVDVRVTFFSGPNGTGDNLGVFISQDAITSDTPTNVWTQLTRGDVVPGGAVSAQMMGFMIGPGAGAMYMDDASFVIIPEPASLGLLGLGGLLMLRRRCNV